LAQGEEICTYPDEGDVGNWQKGSCSPEKDKPQKVNQTPVRKLVRGQQYVLSLTIIHCVLPIMQHSPPPLRLQSTLMFLRDLKVPRQMLTEMNLARSFPQTMKPTQYVTVFIAFASLFDR